MTHPVSRYVPLLIDGDLEGLLDLFGNAPRINDPRLGWIEGTGFEPFVAPSAEGLAVYVRDHTGFLGAVRLYDDVERPPAAA